jgi:hypothetical protein
MVRFRIFNAVSIALPAAAKVVFTAWAPISKSWVTTISSIVKSSSAASVSAAEIISATTRVVIEIARVTALIRISISHEKPPCEFVVCGPSYFFIFD